MLTVFTLLQLGVNLVLLASLALLVRARAAEARRAQVREDELAGLAAALCDLGQTLLPAAGRSSAAAPEPAAPPPPAPSAADPPAQPQAARPALLEGEAQVLRNLRRDAPGEASPKPARRRAGTTTRRSAARSVAAR